MNSIKHERLANIVKEEPIDIEMQTFKSDEEEKFSTTEEFSKNKTTIQTVSIAFLNEETTTYTNQEE